MRTILVTGGCGFVGSSLALLYKKQFPDTRIVCLDNLRRRGSESNIQRLAKKNIKFVHGDIRNKEDLEAVGSVDVILECSAEPSVLAGYNSSPEYVVNTNLLGTLNCLEVARKTHADFIFLSTSRVYPMNLLNKVVIHEDETRFELADRQEIAGVTNKGISEGFPLNGARSLYGATKLASELFIFEYADMYGFNTVINRCGLLAGPGQFGKADQGVIVHWVARHYWGERLSYIGYGGEGKQVRDVLHVQDLFQLIKQQLSKLADYNGQVYNVGGGKDNSLSLKELTELCQTYTGNRVPIDKVVEARPADIPVYISDNTKVSDATGWIPSTRPETMVKEICEWIHENDAQLKGVLDQR